MHPVERPLCTRRRHARRRTGLEFLDRLWVADPIEGRSPTGRRHERRARTRYRVKRTPIADLFGVVVDDVRVLAREVMHLVRIFSDPEEMVGDLDSHLILLDPLDQLPLFIERGGVEGAPDRGLGDEKERLFERSLHTARYCGPHVATVELALIARLDTRSRGECRKDIHYRHDLLEARTASELLGPAEAGDDADSAFESLSLAGAQRHVVCAAECVGGAAVNRVSTGGRVIGEGERIDPVQALRAVTIDAAWQIFRDEELGSIEVGKLADLVVLDGNPLERPEAIRDLEVVQTVVGGVTIYRMEDRRPD